MTATAESTEKENARKAAVYDRLVASKLISRCCGALRGMWCDENCPERTKISHGEGYGTQTTVDIRRRSNAMTTRFMNVFDYAEIGKSEKERTYHVKREGARITERDDAVYGALIETPEGYYRLNPAYRHTVVIDTDEWREMGEEDLSDRAHKLAQTINDEIDREAESEREHVRIETDRVRS